MKKKPKTYTLFTLFLTAPNYGTHCLLVYMEIFIYFFLSFWVGMSVCEIKDKV